MQPRNAAERSRDAGYDSAEARGKADEMSKEQAQEVKESTKEYAQDAEGREGKSGVCKREGWWCCGVEEKSYGEKGY